MTRGTTAALCATSMVESFKLDGLRLVDQTTNEQIIKNKENLNDKLGGKFHADSFLPHYHLHGRRGE